ncbi:hypothetical protein D9757_010013 [Collybiopsis confluens]|uniref:TLC domain-containing protein n=1 Tax=Collybiopsis confluens TaxID=2823264 RepID=A0A8H5GV91_9AGAR|nr:hypothetical protein D9757_010013 [Collybiopsis confluens]
MVSILDSDLALIPSERQQWSTLLLAFFGLVSAYHLAGSNLDLTTVKQKSWIITTVASFTVTVASLPFVWDYFAGWGDVKAVRPFPEFAVLANRFFQAYLLADLSMGAIYYRSQVNLLTGWIHHVLYLGIIEYAIRQNWAHVFCLAGCMEFPTFVLGIAAVFPRLRSNVFFAVSFFVTRILFHIVLVYNYYLPKNRPLSPSALSAFRSLSSFAVEGSPIGSTAPAVILACVFPMHASWFMGCLQGFKKRAKAKREAEVRARESMVPVISAVPDLDKSKISTHRASTMLTSIPALPQFTTDTNTRILFIKRQLPLLRARVHYQHLYDRYSHFYSARYAHYRARLRGPVMGQVARSVSSLRPRLMNLRRLPALERLKSMEGLPSLTNRLPSPQFEMPTFRFEQVAKSLTATLPIRDRRCMSWWGSEGEGGEGRFQHLRIILMPIADGSFSPLSRGEMAEWFKALDLGNLT